MNSGENFSEQNGSFEVVSEKFHGNFEHCTLKLSNLYNYICTIKGIDPFQPIGSTIKRIEIGRDFSVKITETANPPNASLKSESK